MLERDELRADGGQRGILAPHGRGETAVRQNYRQADAGKLTEDRHAGVSARVGDAGDDTEAPRQRVFTGSPEDSFTRLFILDEPRPQSQELVRR